MGLRNFSMHPGSIPEIKQQVLRADLGEPAPQVQRILKMDEPARIARRWNGSPPENTAAVEAHRPWQYNPAFFAVDARSARNAGVV